MAEITAAAVKALRDQTGAGMMDCKRVLQDADGDVEKAVELLRERGLAKAGKREGRATSEGVIAIALDGGVGGMVELGCETDFVARTDDFRALADALASAVVADGSHRQRGGPARGPDRRREGGGPDDRGDRQARRERGAEARGAARGGGPGHRGRLRPRRRQARRARRPSHLGLGARVEGLAKDLAMHVAAADPSPLAVDRDGISPELLESERKIYRKQAEQEGKPEKVIDRIVEGKLDKFTAEVCLLEQAFVKDPDRSVGDLLRDVAKEVGAEIAVSGFRRFKLGEASEA